MTEPPPMVPSRIKAAEYLRRPYARLLVPETDATYRAEILEFPGCIATGDTPAETLESLEDIAISWVEGALENSQPIPAPADVQLIRDGFAAGVRIIAKLREPSDEMLRAVWEGYKVEGNWTFAISEALRALADHLENPT